MLKKEKPKPISYEQIRTIWQIYDCHHYSESRCEDSAIESNIPPLLEVLAWGERMGLANSDEIEEFRKIWQSTGR